MRVSLNARRDVNSKEQPWRGRFLWWRVLQTFVLLAGNIGFSSCTSFVDQICNRRRRALFIKASREHTTSLVILWSSQSNIEPQKKIVIHQNIERTSILFGDVMIFAFKYWTTRRTSLFIKTLREHTSSSVHDIIFAVRTRCSHVLHRPYLASLHSADRTRSGVFNPITPNAHTRRVIPRWRHTASLVRWVKISNVWSG